MCLFPPKLENGDKSREKFPKNIARFPKDIARMMSDITSVSVNCISFIFCNFEGTVCRFNTNNGLHSNMQSWWMEHPWLVCKCSTVWNEHKKNIAYSSTTVPKCRRLTGKRSYIFFINCCIFHVECSIYHAYCMKYCHVIVLWRCTKF